MKNLFKKDKDKGDAQQGGSSSPVMGRSNRSSTPTPISLSGGKNEVGGSLGRSRDKDNRVKDKDKDKEKEKDIKEKDAEKQHAIRIGDTRFYGRIICRAKALYDYPLDGGTLQVEDEEIKLLKFKKGDIINVYEQDTSGWWAGEFNDEKGIFPGSYMKVLEEEAPDTPRGKGSKSQTVAREELLHKICDLEAEKEELMSEHDRDKEEFNKIIKETKTKADAEIAEQRKALNEREETIQASAKKLRHTESELEETTAKLAAKEVEVMTLELEVQDAKSKISDLMMSQHKGATDDRAHNQLRGVQQELASKTQALKDVDAQRQEADRSLREAKAKLQSLEGQILRKVMTSPMADSTGERGDDIDMLKKQLGEEVFEKRRMENEIREMKRMCVDVENLKMDKARLEAELEIKAELEGKLNKIDTILQGLINKDTSTLTVANIKELLGKVRKGIAASSPGGLRSSSTIGNPSFLANAAVSISRSPSPNTPPATINRSSDGTGRATPRPKTTSFYKDNNA